MASAQLHWGRLAAILLRVCYAVFPEIDWGFVFVDDVAWLLRKSGSRLMATSICLLLLALGYTPQLEEDALGGGQYTWLVVIDLQGSCVQMAREKHLLVIRILEDLEMVRSYLCFKSPTPQAGFRGHHCVPLTKPFLQPFRSWKKAAFLRGSRAS